MSRVHDMGGMEGFSIPENLSDSDGPVDADWQAHMFAIIRLLCAKELITLDEFRDAVERLPPDEYLRLGYYERWVRALPELLLRKGTLKDEVPETFSRHDH